MARLADSNHATARKEKEKTVINKETFISVANDELGLVVDYLTAVAICI